MLYSKTGAVDIERINNIEIRKEIDAMLKDRGIDYDTHILLMDIVNQKSGNALMTLYYLLLEVKKHKDIAAMLKISPAAVCKIVKKYEDDIRPILEKAAAESTSREIINPYDPSAPLTQARRDQAFDLVFDSTESGEGADSDKAIQTGTICNLKSWSKYKSCENSKPYYDAKEWDRFTEWPCGETEVSVSGAGMSGEDIGWKAIEERYKLKKAVSVSRQREEWKRKKISEKNKNLNIAG